MKNVLTLFKMYPGSNEPKMATRDAIGTMPLSAYRYCEPMRQATGYGRLLCPPTDILLKFDGITTQYWARDQWTPLTAAYLPGYIDLWNAACPPEFVGMVPPYLRAVADGRGIVQIWSGYLAETAPGWHINVRPPVNYFNDGSFRSYEGIIETDTHAPCPVFTNIQLLKSDQIVLIQKSIPIIQIQPIQRTSYIDSADSYELIVGISDPAASQTPSMSLDDWRRFRETFVASADSETHVLGDYARQVRRGTKSVKDVTPDSSDERG